MPFRKLQFVPGEYYHVFNRGFCKMVIIPKKSEELSYFQQRALKFSLRFNVSIESQSLMRNHFHFILVQNEENDGIEKMMHALQMSFAKYFNRKFKRRGQVFEGRFMAKLINSDQYYWDVTNYVFKNPVRQSLRGEFF